MIKIALNNRQRLAFAVLPFLGVALELLTFYNELLDYIFAIYLVFMFIYCFYLAGWKGCLYIPFLEDV